MNAKQALELAKKNNAVMVDFRFIDWPGSWQHCSFPIDQIDESVAAGADEVPPCMARGCECFAARSWTPSTSTRPWC